MEFSASSSSSSSSSSNSFLWQLANQLSVHYRHQLDWSVEH